ncbi:MAG: hypothetical protein AAF393_05010 [Pseudomonadota bacterium]
MVKRDLIEGQPDLLVIDIQVSTATRVIREMPGCRDTIVLPCGASLTQATR